MRSMSPAALLFMLVMPPGPDAPVAGATPPPASAPAVETTVDSDPDTAPPATPAATPEPVTQPAPAPTVTPTPPPAAQPEPGPKRAPAVAPTESTVFNARQGAESRVADTSYRIGKGFTMASKDERFSLQIRVRFQFRYDLEHYNTAGEAAKAMAQSLQVRRLRLILQGNVFSPYVKYRLQFGFSPRDMQNDLPNEPGSIRRNPLRDIKIEVDRLRDLNFSFGQFKVPFSRQRMLSSSAMNMVDRSLVNAEFNLDRDIGIMFNSKDVGGLGHRLAYFAGVFMGEGRNSFDLTNFGMMYVGRLEFLPFGKFEDATEGDIERSKKPGLAIAAAYAYHDRARAARGVVGDYPADHGTTDFHHMTSDILFKWRGLSLVTAVHLRKGFNRKNGGAVDEMNNPIATVAARSGLGWFGQLGYVVPKIPFEIVGRYGLVRNIYGASSSILEADEAGGGLNWYFVSHDLKLQLDYFRLWDSTMGTTRAEAAANGTDRLRLQLALYF